MSIFGSIEHLRTLKSRTDSVLTKARRTFYADHSRSSLYPGLLHILGTIIIGFVAGVIAKLITPGDREPKGFILTTILGIVGAFVATYLGQAIGWYGPDQNAGFIGAIVGFVIILLVWGLIQRSRETT